MGLAVGKSVELSDVALQQCWVAKVEQYYVDIDRNDFTAVLSLFADCAEYRRQEKVFFGKKEIENFFKFERDLTGKHAILSVWISGSQICVTGIFRGCDSNTQVRISFSDVWQFNGDSMVYFRHSVLKYENDE